MSSNLRTWVVSADMGYGHQRAVFPLRNIAEDGIIVVGNNDSAPASEKKLWKRMLNIYEWLSRTRSIPVIGKPIFNILDTFLHIPSFYPIRDLSKRTFQVDLLDSSIKKGLCSGMLEKVNTRPLPIVTSFYAPAIAADLHSPNRIYCIICDADLNRVWVAKDPWESRIKYFAPCGKAAQRLRAYGVPEDRIYLTGFPLPEELTGGKDLPVLKSDLGQRLIYLDPNNKFRPLQLKNLEHFLGEENLVFQNRRKLTILYGVGGAGAQKEIGGKIAISLKKRILSGEVKLILSAGIKSNVRDYFEEIKKKAAPESENLQIIYSENLQEYFSLFNEAIHETDILWTKPSELSFFAGLGLPIIMTPAIGSQEIFNRTWLTEIGAGIRQLDPEYTDQWLFDYLREGRLADAAWSGFLKARKLGTYKIMEVLEHGKMSAEDSPILR
ncbi:MAG: DUF6938 domain-containing protein [Syntrophothermus sp.]